MKKIIAYLSILFFIAIVVSSCRSSAIVRDRPVPPRYERPVAPGPHYVWVTGEWVRRGGRYVYTQGYWYRQRRGHMYYIAGHWQPKRQGWVWVRGHWR